MIVDRFYDLHQCPHFQKWPPCISLRDACYLEVKIINRQSASDASIDTVLTVCFVNDNYLSKDIHLQMSQRHLFTNKCLLATKWPYSRWTSLPYKEQPSWKQDGQQLTDSTTCTNIITIKNDLPTFLWWMCAIWKYLKLIDRVCLKLWNNLFVSIHL